MPRGPVTSPPRERKRKTSISKILAMGQWIVSSALSVLTTNLPWTAFPVRDERKVEDYNWDRYDTTAA